VPSELARRERPLWGSATGQAFRLTLGLGQHSGDWRSSPTALRHLATTFRERCGLPEMDIRVVEVPVSDPRTMANCAVVLATSNDPLAFSPAECAGIRAYVQAGGLFWLNDSSATEDQRFDQAFQAALPRLFPGAPLVRLEWDHPLLRAAYDLSRGYKGYPIPPGDKYREEFARAVLFGSGKTRRVGLLYTRNDYADGLEIDPRMAAGMKSLTDLTAQEMLEGSLRFGINVVAYALGSAAPKLPPPPDAPPEVAKLYRYHGPPLKPFDNFTDTHYPDGVPVWSAQEFGNPAETGFVPGASEPRPSGSGVAPLADARGSKPSGKAFRALCRGGDKGKVLLGRKTDLDLADAKAIVVDLYWGLGEGIHAALLFQTRPDWDGFETRPIFLRPGWNRNLRFPLNLDDFKSNKTNWKNHDAAFRPRNDVSQLTVVLYTLNEAGELRMESIRIEK
jgi:hypothetical protein